MSRPTRTEYYRDGKFIHVVPSKKFRHPSSGVDSEEDALSAVLKNEIKRFDKTD